MAKSWTVAEVKAGLSACIRDVERGRGMLITRHGKPVAALVPADDLERLERLRAAGPQDGLASVAGGWKGSDELVRHLDAMTRTPKRKLRTTG